MLIKKYILTLSHLSTHLAWNSWEQGNTRNSCLASKSHMHTTHDVWSDSDRIASLLNLYAGSWSMSLLVSPFCLASPNLSANDNKAWTEENQNLVISSTLEENQYFWLSHQHKKINIQLSHQHTHNTRKSIFGYLTTHTLQKKISISGHNNTHYTWKSEHLFFSSTHICLVAKLKDMRHNPRDQFGNGSFVLIAGISDTIKKTMATHWTYSSSNMLYTEIDMQQINTQKNSLQTRRVWVNK